MKKWILIIYYSHKEAYNYNYILKMLQDIVKVLQLYAAIQTFLSWLFLTIMKWEFFYIREVVLNHKHQMLILVLQWELLETTSIFLQGLYAFIVSDFINAFTGKEKWRWSCEDASLYQEIFRVLESQIEVNIDIRMIFLDISIKALGSKLSH